MMNKKYRYLVRARETGDIIDGCTTLNEARQMIADFEAEDKEEMNMYEDNFYEIYDDDKKEIVD